jgi:hypothetical protein
MTAIEDNRNGYWKSVQLSLSYDTEKNVGVSSSGKYVGIDIVAFFKTTPFIIRKETKKYIATPDYWEGLFAQAEQSQIDFAMSQTGTVIDAPNVGSKLIIEGELYYEGSVTETTYNSEIMDPGDKFKEFTTRSGSVSVGGHWTGTTNSGTIYFTQQHYGENLSRTYTTSGEPEEKIGEEMSYEGGTYLISDVKKDNLRLLAKGNSGDTSDVYTLIWDISVSAVSKTGISILGYA